MKGKKATIINLWLRSDGTVRRIEKTGRYPHKHKEATVWRTLAYIYHHERYMVLSRYELEAILSCMKELDTEV